MDRAIKIEGGRPIYTNVDAYHRWITRAILAGAVGALSLSAAAQRGEVVRRPPQKQRAISLRVSDKVEYCIVDSTNNKAVAYVTDGFGNTKQVPCPYPVTTPVFP
jgi:hypothetical protein